MKKTIIIILAVAIVAGLAVLGYQNFKLANIPVPVVVTPQTGLIVDAPLANGLVASPLVVSGHVDGTDYWTGFEGQVGSVTLFDGNGNTLTQKPLTATTDWMQLPTSFSTTLIFSTPTTSVGTLVFKNENPSGMLEREKQFILPVKF